MQMITNSFLFIISNLLLSLTNSLTQPSNSQKSMNTKFCLNCRYFLDNSYTGIQFGKCAQFPHIIEDNSYLITGTSIYQEIDYHYCSTARSTETMCGKEGKIYKRKYQKNK